MLWLILVFFGLLIVFLIFNYEFKKPWRLEVDFLDVGQGDSALIKLPNHQVILIDGGPDNLVLWRLGEVLPFYQRRIDLIISSHYHDDHATGLVEVLKRYHVREIIYQADSASSPIFDTLLSLARQQKIKILPLSNLIKISFQANCFLNLWPPESLGVRADPNNSILSKLNCGQKKFLFSGDNSTTVENAFLKSGVDLRADVFKASHHGSNSANSEKFLLAVEPQLVVISVGATNKFGHPALAVLARLKSLNIKIKRTDQDGTVKIFGQ